MPTIRLRLARTHGGVAQGWHPFHLDLGKHSRSLEVTAKASALLRCLPPIRAVSRSEVVTPTGCQERNLGLLREGFRTLVIGSCTLVSCSPRQMNANEANPANRDRPLRLVRTKDIQEIIPAAERTITHWAKKKILPSYLIGGIRFYDLDEILIALRNSIER
jgi:hypothetical protein